MSNAGAVPAKVRELVDARVELESRLQREAGALGAAAAGGYDRAYARLQKSLVQLFGEASDTATRTTVMLEMIRILENKLVYIENFTVDATTENRMFAALVDRFLDDLGASGSTVLTRLEATYYRAIAALYAGDIRTAREGFAAACESEESDEANDIKYKSYVILGNLAHEARDYAEARALHDASLQYSANQNVTAQALALKALNSYALKELDEALELFQKAIAMFDREAPFFNAYFYRNSLLFAGAILYGRKDYESAAAHYERVLDAVEESSYDYFDAVTQLGRMAYLTGRFDEAAQRFDSAIRSHRFSENELLMDTYFWLAKTRIKQNRIDEAKACLERVAGSAIRYENKPKAIEMLQKVS
ncbi:MAG: tetratricopeptide repeat protein [Thermoanaerobaculia bacterium]